jgi:hypothetical protein
VPCAFASEAVWGFPVGAGQAVWASILEDRWPETRVMSGAAAPPSVSMPSVCGVTSTSTNSADLACQHPDLDRRAFRHAFHPNNTGLALVSNSSEKGRTIGMWVGRLAEKGSASAEFDVPRSIPMIGMGGKPLRQ